MEIKHYTLDANSKLGIPLHLYEFPLSDNYKGFMRKRVTPVTGPATVFISPTGKVSVITTQVLSKKNFKDHRFRRIVDRIKIVDYGLGPDVRDIDLSFLGRCYVKTCLEPALFQENIEIVGGSDFSEGFVAYACSIQHLEQIGGSEFGSEKREPLEELGRSGKVKITID